MRFQAEKPALLAAAKMAARVVSNRHIPALMCLKISASDGAVRVTGTDLDTEICASVEASVSVAGEALCDAAMLVAFLSAPRKTLVSVEATDGNVALACGSSRAEIQSLPVVDFPVFSEKSAPHEAESAFAALAFCAPFASKEETRYYLRGVHFGGGFAVATDGHRMAWTECACDGSAIIPAEVIPAILGMNNPRLFIGDAAFRAEADGVVIRGKIIDGTFPDWRRTIPRGGEIFQVEADDLREAVRAACLGDATIAFLRGEGDAITVSGKNWRAISAVTSAECRATVAQPFAGAINAKYLDGALQAFGGAVVTCSGSGVVNMLSADGRAGKVVVTGWRDEENDWPASRVAAE